jgi:hypothetical protein
MQSKLSRRGVVAGIAIAPMLPTQAVQKEADAELAALGEQFTASVNLLFSDSEWPSNKALLSRLEEIGTAIMDTPATTMPDLVVKARVAYFIQASGLWFWIDPNHEPVGYQPGFAFAMSLVVDLVRRYDPDLVWVSDLTPSPERARHARAMRQGYERRVAADIEAHFRSPCLEWMTVKQLSKRCEHSPDFVEKVADRFTLGSHPLAVTRRGPNGREYRSA